MKKSLLFIGICFSLLSRSLATGEPSTYFNIYVPPNNDPVHRYVALIITAIQDSTEFEIIDDGMDGDSDDSHSGILMARQSYILYIKDNGVNDDAAWSAPGIQRSDGDYFIIRSNKLIYASQSTDSDWQYDWVPSVNKSSKGKKFIVYAPNNSFSNRDINVFAYENQTAITVKQVSSAAKTTTGYTQLNSGKDSIVLQKNINIGEDLIYYYTEGRDIMEPGHTYLIESNKDVTVQYGALFKNARDGGGYVPSSNGSSAGELFYFSVPYDYDLEQEIRIVSWHANNHVRLDVFDKGNWNNLGDWTLDSLASKDWIGKVAQASYPSVFRLECSSGKKLSVFTANWLETGSAGTSDIATMASAVNGTSSGREFLCYMAPPGTEVNVINPFTSQSFNGQYTHLYLFSRDTANVVVKDAYSNGQEFLRHYSISPGRYVDCALELQEWKAIYNGDGKAESGDERPYLHVIADANISVMNTNFNDNWMMYFGSSLEQSFAQKSSCSQTEGIPGDTISIYSKIILNTQQTVTNVNGLVNVSSGALPQTSTFIDSTNMKEIEGLINVSNTGSQITFDSLPDLDTNGNYSIVTDIVLLAGGNDGMVLSDESVITVETSVSGNIEGDIQQSTTSEGVSNIASSTLNLIFSKVNSGNLVNQLSDSWNASWVDIDGDDDQDLFVCTQDLNSPNLLYRNNGDGSFSQINNGAIVNTNSRTMSSAWADVDNDNDMDVLIVNNNYHPLQLYLNNGNGNFNKVVNSGFPRHPAYYHGASWADINNDGYLDVVVTNYMPTRFHELYLNNKNGSFSKVENSLIGMESNYTVAPTWVDYNNDGLMDLFIPNNLGADNSLFKNTGSGFEKVQSVISSDGGYSVAACWADVDKDGDFDLFVANSSGQKDFFYFNNGDGSFTRDSSLSFTEAPSNTHGCSWLDVDNDMDLDLYLTDDQGGKQLYIQQKGFVFVHKTDELVVTNYGKTYGQAVADYNRDGHLDVFVSTHSMQENALWQNNGNDAHFLNIELQGTVSNTNAIGAKLGLKAGGIWQYAFVHNQNGFGSQNSLEQHFGLAENTMADSLLIEWPSGYRQIEVNLAADRFIHITENTSALISGTVFIDKDNDCVMDPGEKGAARQQLEVSPGGKIVQCDETGYFEFRAATGNYTLFHPGGNLWSPNCGVIPINVSPGTAMVNNVQLGIVAQSYEADLEIEYGSTLWRRGFKNQSYLKVENKGTATARQVELELIFPTALFLLESSKAAAQTLANTYSWLIDSLEAGESRVIALTDSVGLSATVGQQLSVTTTVGLVQGESNTFNNQHVFSETVVGAVDPNDLLAWPEAEKEGAFAFVSVLDTIYYKVRFQNTGTYEASNIYIHSDIPEGTIPGSFRSISQSHSCSYSIDQKEIEWTFKNIALPDSNTNEVASHGYVMYALVVDKLAQDGSEILGQASITFDFENPLATNIVVHKVIRPEESAHLRIWPNPSHFDGVVWFSASAAREGVLPTLKQYTLRSMEGIILKKEEVDGKQIKININQLASGSYLLSALDKKGFNYVGVLIIP